MTSLNPNFCNLHEFDEGENTGIIQKTLSKLVFMYSFNAVLGLLDELLELKEYVKHGQALDLISIGKSLKS